MRGKTDSSSLLLFLVYFPRATPPVDPTHSVSDEEPAADTKQPSYRTAVAVTVVCIVHVVILIITSVVIAITQPSQLQIWANVLGIMAAILASIQYFPQIWTTFRLRHVGSLSIPMMCIQTPGSLLWAASLAARLGKEGWSAWGIYVLTAVLQGTLLVMGIYFEYLGPKKDVIEHPYDPDEPSDGQEEQPPSENTPLLQERS